MDKKHGCRLMLLVALFLAISAAGTATPVFSEPMLKMVNIDADSAGAVRRLAGMGLDIAAVRRIGAEKGEEDSLDRRFRVEAVVSALDEIKLKKAGIKWSAAQQTSGLRDMTAMAAKETVYHSFDEPDLGIKDQLYTIAKRNPHIAKLKTIGYSIQGRPLLAMRLTKTWGFQIATTFITILNRRYFL